MIQYSGSRPCPKALVDAWAQLELALTAAMDLDHWQVVQWPTGSGKTEALTVLCATPKPSAHPGALVVTRFTEEADEIVRKINSIAGSAIALAAHQKAPASLTQMNTSPVLVITHEAYRSALREACDKPDLPMRLDLYHNYHHSTRKWMIVDEALNWIDAYEVDLDEASAMCAALTLQLDNEIALDRLSAFIHHLAQAQRATRSDHLLPDER